MSRELLQQAIRVANQAEQLLRREANAIRSLNPGSVKVIPEKRATPEAALLAVSPGSAVAAVRHAAEVLMGARLSGFSVYDVWSPQYRLVQDSAGEGQASASTDAQQTTAAMQANSTATVQDMGNAQQCFTYATSGDVVSSASQSMSTSDSVTSSPSTDAGSPGSISLHDGIAITTNPAAESSRTTANGDFSNANDSGFSGIGATKTDPVDEMFKKASQATATVMDSVANFIDYKDQVQTGSATAQKLGAVAEGVSTGITLYNAYQESSTVGQFAQIVATESAKGYVAATVGAAVTAETLSPHLGVAASAGTAVAIDYTGDVLGAVDSYSRKQLGQVYIYLDQQIRQLYPNPQPH